jgi:hypothetical protein
VKRSRKPPADAPVLFPTHKVVGAYVVPQKPPKEPKKAAAKPELPPHYCAWPGCSQRVPRRMWGCAVHWYKLPDGIREWIWREYVPGQEDRMDPSTGYMRALASANHWILTEGGGPVSVPDPSPVVHDRRPDVLDVVPDSSHLPADQRPVTNGGPPP